MLTGHIIFDLEVLLVVILVCIFIDLLTYLWSISLIWSGSSTKAET